jgi:outer membrane protein OmpA-like peptidoglycan-associated protein
MILQSPTGLKLKPPSLRPKPRNLLPLLLIASGLMAAIALSVHATRGARASGNPTVGAPSGPASSGNRTTTTPSSVSRPQAPTVPTAGSDAPRIVPLSEALPTVTSSTAAPTKVPGSSRSLPTAAVPAAEPPSQCPGWVIDRAWFRPDDPSIEPAASPIMDDLANGLRGNDWPISIVGHTDTRLTNFPGGNQALSEARARAVADAIVSRGVDSKRLILVGKAATEPVMGGSSAEAHEANRRVVVTTMCNG